MGDPVAPIVETPLVVGVGLLIAGPAVWIGILHILILIALSLCGLNRGRVWELWRTAPEEVFSFPLLPLLVPAAAAETATVHSIVFAWRAAVISEDALARAAWSIAEIPLYIDSSTSCEGSRCGSLIPQSREKAASEFQ